MNIQRGNMFLRLYSLDNVLCLIMVVFEQGNPFPERFVRSSSFRFLICGTLLGGLVLSNAFKSTNVYNIVLPRSSLKFGVIEELLDHGYSLHSKLARIGFYFENFGDGKQATDVVVENSFEHKILTIRIKKGYVIFSSGVETNFYMGNIYRAPNNAVQKERSLILQLMTKSGPHSGILSTIKDTLKLFYKLNAKREIDTVKYYRQIDKEYAQKDEVSVIIVDFWKKQDQFILDDLQKCNKTAWIAPD